MKRFFIAAVALASVSSAFAGEIVISSNVIGEGSMDSPVTSALNWDSVDIELFGGAAYDGGLLVNRIRGSITIGAPASHSIASGDYRALGIMRPQLCCLQSQTMMLQ